MAISFDDLVNYVITETDRADMTYKSQGGSGEIPSAIQSGTLFLHGLDTFPKDVINARLAFDVSRYIQMIDTRQLRNFRNMCFLRKSDPSLDAYEQNPTALPPLISGVDGIVNSFQRRTGFFKAIAPNDILDMYGAELSDVYYQAGNMLYAKSSSSFQYAELGWLAWPSIGNRSNDDYSSYSSWIAQEYPFAIVYWAASKIYQATGQQDMSRKYDSPEDPRDPLNSGGLVQSQIRNLVKNNILVEAM